MKKNNSTEETKMLRTMSDSMLFDNTDNRNNFFQLKYQSNDANSYLWHKRPKNFIEPNDVILQGVFEKVGRNFNVKLNRTYYISNSCLYYKKVKKYSEFCNNYNVYLYLEWGIQKNFRIFGLFSNIFRNH